MRRSVPKPRRCVLCEPPFPMQWNSPLPQQGSFILRRPQGVKAWFQVHPAEPAVGNNLPHVKYADWTGGKKGRGGSWSHIFFPPPVGP